MVECLIEEIDASISVDNSQILSAKLIDPTPLATRLWQTIWVATGKSPMKYLYNVVELFIFKFLSDLRVLDEDISFNRVDQKVIRTPPKIYSRIWESNQN
jgi:type I restriction enzyme M protein